MTQEQPVYTPPKVGCLKTCAIIVDKKNGCGYWCLRCPNRMVDLRTSA